MVRRVAYLIGALGLVLTPWGRAASSSRDALYVRFQMPDGAATYLQVQPRKEVLRVAGTAAGLDKAKNVHADQSRDGQGYKLTVFPSVDVYPCNTAATGKRRAGAKTELRVQVVTSVLQRGTTTTVSGRLTVARADEAGVEWSMTLGTPFPSGASPEEAPAFEIPTEPLTMEITLKGKQAMLGAGVQLASGRSPVQDVRRGQQPVRCEVALSDEKGKTVAEGSKTLPEVGFG